MTTIDIFVIGLAVLTCAALIIWAGKIMARWLGNLIAYSKRIL